MIPDSIAWHSRFARAFDAKYDASPAFIQRLQVWGGAIARYAEPNYSVLDAGCGTGALTFLAAAQCRAALGIDASSEMIAICEEKKSRSRTPNVQFAIVRLDQLCDHITQSYDLILCSSVLEYVPDFWAAIDRLISRLTPRGVLLFSVPNSGSVYRWCERAAFAVCGKPAYLRYVRHVPAQRSIASGLKERGLLTIDTTYYGWSPLASGLGQHIAAHQRFATLVLYACRRHNCAPSSR